MVSPGDPTYVRMRFLQAACSEFLMFLDLFLLTFLVVFLLFCCAMSGEFGSRSLPIVIDSDSDSDGSDPVQVSGSPLKVLHSKRYR